jgi:hypothetical protein
MSNYRLNDQTISWISRLWEKRRKHEKELTLRKRKKRRVYAEPKENLGAGKAAGQGLLWN